MSDLIKYIAVCLIGAAVCTLAIKTLLDEWGML